MATALTKFRDLFLQSTVWQTLAEDHALIGDSIFFTTGESNILPFVVISQNSTGGLSGSGDSSTFVSNGSIACVIHLKSPAGSNTSEESILIQEDYENLRQSLIDLSGTGTHIFLRSLVFDAPQRSDSTVESKSGDAYWQISGNAEWGLENV